MRVEEVGNGLDQARGEEHPGLRRVDADVVEDRVELRGDELRRQLVDRRDAGRVLRGERHDRAHPVAARGGERLQVGLDARAAARVGRGDGQRAWDDLLLPSPALPGSGSAGLFSASSRGTPVGRG